MSRRRTFFERITGTVHVDDQYDDDNYDDDDSYEPTIQGNHQNHLADRYRNPYDYQSEPVNQINNTVYQPNQPVSQDYTGNNSTFNDDQWLPKTEHGGELSVDLYELDDEIILQCMIAGVKPTDLDINVTREMVTIEGHREGPQGIPDENYHQQELFWGAFNRTIMLPDEVEVEEAEASEAHGLLTIRMPKIDKARSTKLKVKTR